MNKKGYEYTNKLLEKSYKPIDYYQFKQYIQDTSVVILDTRDIEESAKGFIPGSTIISLNNLFAIWTAILYKRDTKFIIIAEYGKERESIIRLARVGLENCLGYLEGGFKIWTNNEEEIDSYQFIDLLNKEESNKYTVFDVREENEWEKTGVIPGSILISLSKLSGRIDEIPKEVNIVTICLTGQRSATTISILKKLGFKNIIANAKGGLQYLLDNQYYNLINFINL
jgi:rhodanese-related sulfurtransferase